MATLTWRKQQIYVVQRTPEMVASADEGRGRAEGRRVARSPTSRTTRRTRSARASLNSWCSSAICTHLGCLPKPRFEAGQPELGANWPGGFFCPCHGSRFDLAGRVFEGSPASVNLRVPPYAFANDHTLVIGVDDSERRRRDGDSRGYRAIAATAWNTHEGLQGLALQAPAGRGVHLETS